MWLRRTSIRVRVFLLVLIPLLALRRLADLRESALTLAHRQLPGVMARLRRVERVDVDAEAPPARSSADELDQVREAFTVVHRAAVAAAVDEANLRRGVNEVFRNQGRKLSRRAGGRARRCQASMRAAARRSAARWAGGRQLVAARGPMGSIEDRDPRAGTRAGIDQAGICAACATLIPVDALPPRAGCC